MIASLILSTVAVVSPGSSQAGADRHPAPDGNRLVKVALSADHAAIRPGETCTLAVKLAIEPKWHIYWQNPGDAGVPTRVVVHAPKGFEVGGVRYPAPAREEAPGDIVSFVYTGEIALLVDLKAPAELSPGAKVELGVECSWLVCTTLCVQGRGEARIDLAAAPASEPARLSHEKEFEAWRAKLPRPYEDLLAIAGYHDSGFGERNAIEVSVPGAVALDFYPYVEDPITLNLETLRLKRTNEGCTMTLSFEPPAGYEGPRYGFSGLVVVRTLKGESFYETGFAYTAAGTDAGAKRKS